MAALHKRVRELEEQTITDPLTGAYNRRHLHRRPQRGSRTPTPIRRTRVAAAVRHRSIQTDQRRTRSCRRRSRLEGAGRVDRTAIPQARCALSRRRRGIHPAALGREVCRRPLDCRRTPTSGAGRPAGCRLGCINQRRCRGARARAVHCRLDRGGRCGAVSSEAMRGATASPVGAVITHRSRRMAMTTACHFRHAFPDATHHFSASGNAVRP